MIHHCQGLIFQEPLIMRVSGATKDTGVADCCSLDSSPSDHLPPFTHDSKLFPSSLGPVHPLAQ